MTKITKSLLVFTVVTLPLGLLFATGVLDVGNIPGLYVTFPAGAISFGLFLIFRIMEKEAAEFDAEQRTHENSTGEINRPEPDHGCGRHSASRA